MDERNGTEASGGCPPTSLGPSLGSTGPPVPPLLECAQVGALRRELWCNKLRSEVSMAPSLGMASDRAKCSVGLDFGQEIVQMAYAEVL